MTSFKVRYSEEFAKDLSGLDNAAKRIAVKILRRILAEPDRGKRLVGPLAGCIRERFLNYRIIYRVNETEKFAEFIKIKKRDQAYQ